MGMVVSPGRKGSKRVAEESGNSQEGKACVNGEAGIGRWDLWDRTFS